MSRAWHALAACRDDGVGWLDKPQADQLADCASCPVTLQCLQQAITDCSTGVIMGGVVIGKRPITEARIA